MNRSDLRVRVGTPISPYRGSTCYKRRTSPFQNIHIGPQADIEKGTKRVYLPLHTIFRNVSWLYLFIKKRVVHLSGAGGTNRRGEEGEGGATSPLPCGSRTAHPFARPGEIRFLERS